MLPTLTSPVARPRNPQRLRVPFRYCAAVTGTGEIQGIQEFIGRRFVRQLDPSGRLGRDLLIRGQVSLWCHSIVEGERLPVGALLDRLHTQAVREMDGGAGQSWDRSCRQRLETIERWQSFYGAAGLSRGC